MISSRRGLQLEQCPELRLANDHTEDEMKERGCVARVSTLGN